MVSLGEAVDVWLQCVDISQNLMADMDNLQNELDLGSITVASLTHDNELH